MIESLDDVRDMLTDLQQVAGISGFRPGKGARPETARLDTPVQVKEMLSDLLVEALGMEVKGL